MHYSIFYSKVILRLPELILITYISERTFFIGIQAGIKVEFS